MDNTTEHAAAAQAFAALGSDVRLGLVKRLVRAGPAGMTVGALQEASGIPGSTLNHHLRALVGAGLVAQERDGRSLICSARFGQIEALAGFLLSECCVDSNGAVRALMEDGR